MLSDAEIKSYLEKLLKEIKSDTTDIATLSAICICLRSLLESLYKIPSECDKWVITHSFLHIEAAKTTDSVILHNVLNIVENFKGKFPSIICNIRDVVLEKHPIIDHKFYDFKFSEKYKDSNFVIISSKLVSTKPILYEIIARYDNDKDSNKLTFFSKIKLNKYSLYRLSLSYYKNSMGHTFWISDSSKRYLNPTKFDYLKTIKNLKENVLKFDSNILYELLKPNVLENILDEFLKSNEELKQWPYNNVNGRESFVLIQSILANDKYTLKRIKNLNMDYRKFYPLIKDPLVSRAPITNIPKNIMLRMMIYYCLSDEKIKNYLQDAEINDFLIENQLLLAINPKLKIWNRNGSTPRSSWSENKHISTQENFELLRILSEISKKSNIVIAPAGHGKSNWVKKNLLNNEARISLYTPTTKAQEVYSKYFDKKNIDIQNIQKISNGNGKFDDKDIYIFDEISMYGYKEWKEIYNILDKKIYLVGDPFQLPPINGTNVSKYISHLGKSKVELLENWRISKSKNKDSLQKLFDDLRKRKINLKSGGYSNMFFGYKKISEIFEVIANKKYSSYKILVYKNNGIISVRNLNRILANREDFKFKVGDEVIFNDLIKVKSSGKRASLYPGKRILITEIEVKGEIKKYTFADNISLNIENNEEPFNLSKVMTAHRSQGQTIDNVLVIVDSNEINFEWLYTAASRTSGNLKILIKSILLKNHFDPLKKIPNKLKTILKNKS